MRTISIAQCRALVEQGAGIHLLDVRTPGEFARAHAVGARLMPLDRLDPAAVAAQRPDAAEPILTICKGGGRSARACQKLEEAGITGVYSVAGGTDAWAQAGLPMVRGAGKVISLERQVRIAAGVLVLAGSLLAWLNHPGFLAVPLFIGSGLTFAGLTDFCGMGLLLAKAPWNR